MSQPSSTEGMLYGVDIGGTKMELVAYQGADLTERWRRRVDTPTRDFTAFVEALAGLVEAADASLGQRGAIGLGLPGVVDPRSGLQLSSNVPALNGQAVAPALTARLQRPVVIGNDCQCFALSEACGGAAAGAESMFGAILGTGAGGGYCVGGRLLRGYNSLAGEWGHCSLPATLREQHGLPLWPCACGLNACLERYVSGSGLAALYRYFGGPALDAAAINAQAEAGEALAQRTLAVHLDLLAHGLAGLVLVLDPHVIVLGGGLSKLQRLYRDLPAAVARHLFAGARVPQILPPAFGDAGGTRGAALLARQQQQQ
ncbi:ROK family protein [Paucibacter sp. TC2R-5]|uniref:ROK family protein n=1 Tax=Paucibacter sp. TC2R-5 TaxID=2893555 RepID=UPI0021E45B15|nr:ROK family protein [Paucibacter sp. TC2R-5]MCV2359900.1 ROK family protein [Paucibacter sp. TC2R-5]